MTVAKITISLPHDLVLRMKRAVADGRADSISGLVAQAMNTELDDQALTEMLDDMLEESGGPMTPAETAWAETVFGMPDATS